MGRLIRFFLNRAREASTWRGMILLFCGSWAAKNPEQAEAAIVMGMAAAGFIGAFFPDTAKKSPDDFSPIELQGRPSGDSDTVWMRSSSLPADGSLERGAGSDVGFGDK